MFSKRSFILFTGLLASACSSLQSSDDIISVYTIGDKNCKGSDEQINWCNDITLLEFVKGNFYKISNDEIAFVTWSGKGELTYTARKYEGVHLVESYPFTLILSTESEYLEKIVFTSKNQGTYTFGNPNGSDMSSLQLQSALLLSP